MLVFTQLFTFFKSVLFHYFCPAVSQCVCNCHSSLWSRSHRQAEPLIELHSMGKLKTCLKILDLGGSDWQRQTLQLKPCLQSGEDRLSRWVLKNRKKRFALSKPTSFVLAFNLSLHWRRLCDNAGNSDTHYLLALATLGGMTEIEMILIAKVSKDDNIRT